MPEAPSVAYTLELGHDSAAVVVHRGDVEPPPARRPTTSVYLAPQLADHRAPRAHTFP